MGRIIKGERNEGPNYTLKRSKGVIQKMDRLDFCELLIAPDYEKEMPSLSINKKTIKYDEKYKFFNLQVETKILIPSNNSATFIDYWRGHITVLPSEVKIKKNKMDRSKIQHSERMDISSNRRAGYSISGDISTDGIDKVRVKNLLYPLKNLYIHGRWKEITDEKLTFSCNNSNDNYLKLSEDDKLVFGAKLYNLYDSSFKTSDWLIEKMKEVIDQIY